MGELGYFVEYQVLNSADFGVPQNRQRVFIIGHLGGHRGRQVFPIASDSEQTIELQGHKIRTGTLDTRIDGNTRGTYPVEIEGGGGGSKSKRISQRVLISGRSESHKPHITDTVGTITARVGANPGFINSYIIGE